MGLTRLAVRRPLFMTMVFLAVVVFGMASYQRLGVNLLPKVEFPQITVVTAYPGASAESVERLVTIPMEDALSGLNDLDSVTSTSVEGTSTVVLAFSERANSDIAALDAERAANAIRSKLPSDTRAPTIIKANLNALPVMNLAMSGPGTPAELTRLAEDSVVPRLKTVPGVSSVTAVGGRSREVQVKVKPERLQAYNISLSQLTTALAQENVNVPSGQVTDGGTEYSIRLNSLAKEPRDLGSIILSSTSSGTTYLRDVATVEDTTVKLTQINRSDGEDSIGLLVAKQSEANTIAVADGTRKAVAALQPQLPVGTRLEVVTDGSTFTRSSLDGIQRELIEAVLLVGVVLLLFLHTWRSTFIVLLAIPTSLIATFIVMFATDITLNTMSLLGLTLTIGALVDDSIVVLENIFRCLELGETPLTAAINGRSEIGVAAIAITLVDVVIFAPIAFLSGITGQFFREFGLVIVAAVLFSLLVSFTLTPMLASRWLRAPQPNDRAPLSRFGRVWERGYSLLASSYRGLLAWSLRHRWPVIVAGVASLGTGVLLVAGSFVGTELFPESDQGYFTLLAEMPPGTPLETTGQALSLIEGRLGTWPEVERTFTSVGVGGDNQPNQARYGRMVVKLVPIGERSESATALATAARNLASEVPSLKLRAQTPSLGGASGQAIQAQVIGEDIDRLKSLSREVEEILQSTRGTRDITNSWLEGQPEIVMNVDWDRAADLGVTSTQAASALRIALSGTVATQFRPESGKGVDVRVVAQESSVERISQLGQLLVTTTRGTTIQLGQLATIEQQAGTPQINRRDRSRLILVAADAAGRPSGDISADVREKLETLTVPDGFTVKLAGQSAEQQTSFVALFQALGLSVLLTYMVTVALYESLVTPFVVLLSLPLAGVGAVLGLAISGNTLNILSLIGFILLTGLVGKNAILLLDYTLTLRKQGMARDEALMVAGPIRLRPIIMTAAALIIALLPVALSAGEGSEIRRPVAIPVIGGMISSTLLTLVFIPAFYTVVDDFQQWVRGLVQRQPRFVKEEFAVLAGEGSEQVQPSDGEHISAEAAKRK